MQVIGMRDLMRALEDIRATDVDSELHNFEIQVRKQYGEHVDRREVEIVKNVITVVPLSQK